MNQHPAPPPDRAASRVSWTLALVGATLAEAAEAFEIVAGKYGNPKVQCSGCEPRFTGEIVVEFAPTCGDEAIARPVAPAGPPAPQWPAAPPARTDADLAPEPDAPTGGDPTGKIPF